MSLNKSEVHSNNKNALSESTTINISLPPLIGKGQNSQSTSELNLSNAKNLNPQNAYVNKGVEYIHQEDSKTIVNESYLVDYDGVMEDADYVDTKNEVKLFYKNGNIRFIGQVDKRALPDGSGVEYHENGSMKYNGYFKDGWIEGEKCTIFDEKGRKKYQGGMFKGKKHNFGILYEKNGEEIYEGQFKDDAIHNKQCVIYNKDGSVLYVGGIESGKFHGKVNLLPIYWNLFFNKITLKYLFK